MERGGGARSRAGGWREGGALSRRQDTRGLGDSRIFGQGCRGVGGKAELHSRGTCVALSDGVCDGISDIVCDIHFRVFLTCKRICFTRQLVWPFLTLCVTSSVNSASVTPSVTLSDLCRYEDVLHEGNCQARV